MPNQNSPGQHPSRNIECVALVKPGSTLAKELKLTNPTYGIYEYIRAFGRHHLRFGDGNWYNLEAEDLSDLALLDLYGPDLVRLLFGDHVNQ